MNIKTLISSTITTISICIVFLLSVIVLSELATELKTKNLHTSVVQNVPSEYQVALVPGTIKYIGGTNIINYYYQFRIKAMTELYQAGNIERIIVSGDNSRANYDEPSTIKEDLVLQGIPEEIIFLDYAGFSTLDSVIRAREIFGQDKLVIVSQAFHNKRAIVLAKDKNIDLYGYDAFDYPLPTGMRIKARERLARIKMWFDVFTNTAPTFLGDPVDMYQSQ